MFGCIVEPNRSRSLRAPLSNFDSLVEVCGTLGMLGVVEMAGHTGAMFGCIVEPYCSRISRTSLSNGDSLVEVCGILGIIGLPEMAGHICVVTMVGRMVDPNCCCNIRTSSSNFDFLAETLPFIVRACAADRGRHYLLFFVMV
jgi:hypothetical protein